MKLAFNKGDNGTTEYTPPGKTSSARNGLHLVESLAKVLP